MHLDELIAQVDGESPLDRLASAMGVKADLDDLADALIGHFVDQARRAGCSWSEIGMAMGVSKQAAQQRHTAERPAKRDRPWKMGRLTPRARASVREAEDAARRLGHEEVEAEHLLLGLIAVSEGIAAKSLAGFGVSRDAVMARLEPGAAEGHGHGRRRRAVPFAPAAKEVIEGALVEAIGLVHNYVGTEHLLLALFRAPSGRAATILAELGLDHDAVRRDVLDRIERVAS